MPRLRFGQNDVRFKLRGVRCGLPTNHPEMVEEVGGRTIFARTSACLIQLSLPIR
jgi:hypothetical protein